MTGTEPQEEEGLAYECLIIGLDCKRPMREYSMGLENATAFFERRPRVRINTSKHFKDNATADMRRERLGNMLNGDESHSLQSFSHPISEGKQCTHFRPEQLLVEHSRNWPSDELLRSVDGLVVGIVLWLANFLYGAINVAAWNDHFPSTAEKWLWRASAVYIGFCGGLWVILNFIVMRHRPLNDFWEKWMDGEKGWFESLTLGALVVICGFSLMLARAYIVIEAFVSIRQLPASAYETPSWSQISPHF